MKKVYFYIDSNNQVVYANFEESYKNKDNKRLRRYTAVNIETFGLFVKYWKLGLHPMALNNVVR